MTEEVLSAIRWAIGIRDDAVALSVARNLPPAVLQEQLALYKKGDAEPAKKAKPEKLKINPHMLKDRARAVWAFERWLVETGVDPRKRTPRGGNPQIRPGFLGVPPRLGSKSPRPTDLGVAM